MTGEGAPLLNEDSLNSVDTAAGSRSNHAEFAPSKVVGERGTTARERPQAPPRGSAMTGGARTPAARTQGRRGRHPAKEGPARRAGGFTDPAHERVASSCSLVARLQSHARREPTVSPELELICASNSGDMPRTTADAAGDSPSLRFNRASLGQTGSTMRCLNP